MTFTVDPVQFPRKRGAVYVVSHTEDEALEGVYRGANGYEKARELVRHSAGALEMRIGHFESDTEIRTI